MTSQTRKEVEEHFIDFIAKAEAEGKDGLDAAIKAFPDVPDMVLILAAAEHDSRKIAAWWRTVEKTIDAEVIQRAIGALDEEKPS